MQLLQITLIFKTIITSATKADTLNQSSHVFLSGVERRSRKLMMYPITLKAEIL